MPGPLSGQLILNWFPPGCGSRSCTMRNSHTPVKHFGRRTEPGKGSWSVLNPSVG